MRRQKWSGRRWALPSSSVLIKQFSFWSWKICERVHPVLRFNWVTKMMSNSMRSIRHRAHLPERASPLSLPFIRLQTRADSKPSLYDGWSLDHCQLETIFPILVPFGGTRGLVPRSRGVTHFVSSRSFKSPSIKGALLRGYAGLHLSIWFWYVSRGIENCTSTMDVYRLTQWRDSIHRKLPIPKLRERELVLSMFLGL